MRADAKERDGAATVETCESVITMNPLSSTQVNRLLESAGPGAVVYLIGAGGCGMSGLGHLLLDLGFTVVGSDLQLNQEIQQLRARGARIHTGHKAAHVHTARPALIVYSSAIRSHNPELVAAQDMRLPVVRRAVLLAALLHRQRGLCVAGMHGKTTTAALLAFALEQLHANPSFAIGAPVPQLGRHARFTNSHFADDPPRCMPTAQRYFVVETDESDGTLREFHPAHALVLNVDEEHLDYFSGFEAVCCEFKAFAEQTQGRVLFCADDPRLAELLSRHPGALSYGFNPLATYRIEMLPPPSSEPDAPDPLTAPERNHATRNSHHVTRFALWHRGERLGEFLTQLLGDKNVSNTAAVVAMLHQLGFGAPEIAGAVAGFRGVARRQELLFADDRFRVFDDYGHHPAEIETTLRALRLLRPRRLLVAFQPHRFTRTQRLLSQFATCFRQADCLWLTDIYPANEPPIPGVTAQTLADAVRATGQAAVHIENLDELVRAVRAAMQPGDLVLVLGAGDITQAAHQLAETLRTERPTSKEQLHLELTSRLSAESVVRLDEPLAKRTTLRVGGPADFFVEPASEADLAAGLRFCAARRLPFIVIGRGSNLLVRDGGIRGVVISLAHSNFSGVEVVGDRLHCGAGAKLKTLAVEAKRQGLAGLEFLEGIPGTLGGALRMNAGAMGSWICDVLDVLRVMDYSGQVRELPASEVQFEYRGCPLFRDHIALSAVLKGAPMPREVIEERMNSFSQRRWETQPAAPSAGCIFKNPREVPAGKLIDELGLKGRRIGGAAVSEVHANFIVNEGDASAADVLRLIELIKQEAKSTRGIELETEVEILGEG
jgi:UDP-N-acetylmuramate--L-alanine ligase/UDP-N-acetylenolpyruvoylglucosamine reductase